MAKVQKSNNTTNNEQALNTGVSVLIPASPVLLECIHLLKTVTDKLHSWSDQHKEIADGALEYGIESITVPIDELVSTISEVVRFEMVDNIYFGQKSA